MSKAVYFSNEGLIMYFKKLSFLLLYFFCACHSETPVQPSTLLNESIPDFQNDSFFCKNFSQKYRYQFKAKRYSHTNAALLSEASFLTYAEEPIDFLRWLKIFSQKPGQVKGSYIEDPEHKTRVYLGWNIPANKADEAFLIISFRGPNNHQNILTDIELTQSSTFIDRAGKANDTFLFGKQHSGITKAYLSLRSTLLEAIKKIPDTYFSPQDNKKDIIRNKKKRKVFITGHSLGGALATLFAVDMGIQNNRDNPMFFNIAEESTVSESICSTIAPSYSSSMPFDSVYVFGSPRVGNPAFANCSSRLLQNKFFRVNYGSDAVSRVPNINYLHVGGRYYNYNGGVEIGAVEFRSFLSDETRQDGDLDIGEIVDELSLTLGTDILRSLSRKRDVLIQDHLLYPIILRGYSDKSCLKQQP